MFLQFADLKSSVLINKPWSKFDNEPSQRCKDLVLMIADTQILFYREITEHELCILSYRLLILNRTAW